MSVCVCCCQKRHICKKKNPKPHQHDESSAGRASFRSHRSSPNAASPPAVKAPPGGFYFGAPRAASKPEPKEKDFLVPEKRELRQLSAAGEARDGHQDSAPSSWRGSPRRRGTATCRGAGAVPSETVRCCTGCVRRNRRLRREGPARYAAVPQQEEDIKSHINEDNKPPRQVLPFSIAFTFAVTIKNPPQENQPEKSRLIKSPAAQFWLETLSSSPGKPNISQSRLPGDATAPRRL